MVAKASIVMLFEPDFRCDYYDDSRLIIAAEEVEPPESKMGLCTSPILATKMSRKIDSKTSFKSISKTSR